MIERQLGTLKARITGGTDQKGGGAGPVVVLLHGYGAPGTDLVPLAQELSVPDAVRFVFPEAPLELGFGGRAWWPLDMARLQERFSKGTAERLSEEVPAGIDAARDALLGLLAALEKDFQAPADRTLIGGFSQGAMLATDVVLRSVRPFAGLAVLSGSLISHGQWLPLMAARQGLPVLQSHGRSDSVLPFALAERLRDELRAAGLLVEFVAFNGGHGIPGSVLDSLGALIRRIELAKPA
jgi:phospholipase/carboxylesterase